MYAIRSYYDRVPFFAAADHADVSRIGFEGLSEHVPIVEMAAGDDDHIIIRNNFV